MTGLSFGWPDVVIVVVLALAVIKGLTRGFVSELGGIAALVLALAAVLFYNGVLDDGLEHAFNLNPGWAHITGLVLSGVIVYGVILLLTRLLNRVMRLPVLGTGNAIGGGVVGFAKGAVLLWVVLFVALLFPLSRGIRVQLHESHLVTLLLRQNRVVDDAIYSRLPDIAKPFARPILRGHQV